MFQTLSSMLALWYFFDHSFASSNSSNFANLVMLGLEGPLASYLGAIAAKSKRQALDLAAARAAHKEEELSGLFRLTFEGAPSGLIMIDDRGEILLVNPQVEKIFGFTKEELIGQTIETLIPVDLRDKHRKYRESFVRAPERRRMGVGRDLYGMRKDGSRVPVEIGLSPIRTQAGTLVLDSIIDISDRKHAEEEKRDAEQRVRLALEATKVGFWEWNVFTGRVRWDAQMFEIYGLNPTPDGFVTYSTWSSAVLPEDLQAQEEVLQKTVRHGGQSSREFRIRKPGTAECRYIEAVETVRTNAQGKNEWIVGTNIDITARKRAEEESARLAAIVTFSEDAIISKNLDGVLDSWNLGAERLFGYTASEVIGKPITLLIPEDRLEEESEILSRIIGGEVVDHFETLRRCKNGTLINVSLTISPLKDAAGRITGASKIVRDITERKRAEETLQAQKRLYRSVTDNASVALFILDNQQRCVFMNPAAEQLTGYTLKEASGRALHDVMHHTDGSPHPLSECRIDQAFPEQNRKQGEEVFVHRDGHFYDAAFTASPLRDEHGTPVGTIIEVQDITAKKIAEKNLREAEAKSKLITDALPVLLSYIDQDLRYRIVNPMYKKWFGLEAVDVVGRRVDEILGPAAFEAVRPAMEQALSGESVTFEKLLPYKGAGLRHIHGLYIPDFDADGRVRGFIVLVNDITQQKVAELSLRESEARFRAIYELAPIGIMQVDLETERVLEVNRYLCTLLETSREELRLKHLHDIMHWTAPSTGEIADGKSDDWVREVSLQLREGRQLPVQIQMSTIKVENGPRYRLFLVENLTERKRAEDERLNLERERIARLEADHTNKMKDEFLATLSHELRAPLNSIIGWIQLTRKRKQVPVEMEETLGVIERSAKTQSQLIADILDVNRIASGKLRLEIKKGIDVADIANAAIEIMLPTAQAKNIKIERRFDEALPRINGDSRRLQQCVWNLLSNALKFAPQDSRVAVELRCVGKDIEISVSDSGQGIRADLLPHIFGRYMQADSSSTRTHGGLGLGLAIVKHLVTLHGGSVSAESPGEGLGSTFTIRLPCSESSSDKPALTSGSQGSLASTRLGGLTILVVDDELEARELLRGLIEDAGATVLTAASADEGLKLAETKKPALIVSDIAMPFRNGYSLIREIRKHGSDIPAIALTAYAQDSDRSMALEAGFQEHFAKPVEVEKLLQSIARLIGPTPELAA